MHKISTQHARKSLVIGIVLNLVFTLIEFFYGFATQSLALLSDAAHNLGDTVSLFIALIAFRLSEQVENKQFTYGYKKATVLASLINAVALLVIAGGIFIESYDRFIHPPTLPGLTVSLVAGVGIIINTATALLFLKDKDKDINMKGAYLHMAADALVSVGVVISGTVIYFFDLPIIDPIISWVVAIVIIYSTWGVFKESLNLTMNGVPKDISLDQIKDHLLEHPEVQHIHHMHLWPLSTTENAMTVHLEVDAKMTLNEVESLNLSIKQTMLQYDVHHITIEVDPFDPDRNREVSEATE